MLNTYLIKKPILSEKTYKQMENGIYTFLVSTAANKKEIAKFVESQFGVNVISVRTIKKTTKTKRISGTRKVTKAASLKKAIVALKEGQSISMLSPKSEKAKIKKKESENKSVKEQESKKPGEKKGLLSRIRKQKEEKEEEK